MRKLLTISILFMCACLSSNGLYAQNLFTGGSFTLNPGVGYGYNYGYLGTFYPAISISGDCGLKVNAGPGTIALGGIIGFKLGYYNYYSGYTDNYSETVLAVRGTYHWTPTGAPKLDLYGGIPVGIRFDHYSEWGTYFTGSYDVYGDPIYHYSQVSATTTYPFLGIFIGAAYYFNNRVGIFGELGYDVSVLTLGVSFKLK